MEASTGVRMPAQMSEQHGGQEFGKGDGNTRRLLFRTAAFASALQPDRGMLGQHKWLQNLHHRAQKHEWIKKRRSPLSCEP